MPRTTIEDLLEGPTGSVLEFFFVRVRSREMNHFSILFLKELPDFPISKTDYDKVGIKTC